MERRRRVWPVWAMRAWKGWRPRGLLPVEEGSVRPCVSREGCTDALRTSASYSLAAGTPVSRSLSRELQRGPVCSHRPLLVLIPVGGIVGAY